MDRLRQLWTDLPNGQQRLLAVLALTTVGLGAVMWGLTRRGEFEPLFTSLSSEDTGQVTAELNKRAIPYKVGSQPGTVLVPGDLIARTRMELAAVGLPQSGSIGFEVFDKSNFMTTDFMQRMSYLRGLQGELARSIASLEPVSAARVHITLPQPSIFRQDAPQASASVVLTLKPARTLTPLQAKGIGFLVSRAVEGLKPEGVFITDTQGKVLWTGYDSSGLNEEQLEAKEQVERGIERRVQSMLDQALGVGKAIVRVSAEVDLERHDITSETYLPAEQGRGIATSHTELTEDYKSPGGSSSTTAAGPRPSLPSVAVSGGNGTYTKRQVNSQYQVSKRSETIHAPAGKIKRLSVAVLADQGKDSARLSGLREAIASAAGIDPKRGDSIVMTPVEFGKAPMPAADSGERLELVKTVLRSVLMLIAMIGGLFMAKMLLSLPRSARYLVPAHVGQTALAGVGETKARTAPPRSLPGLDDHVGAARTMATQQPSEAVEVVKLWLSGE